MNYTIEEENLIVQTATEKRIELQKRNENKEKFFQMRSNVIQNYFIRLSTSDVVKFMLKLLDNIKGLTTIMQIIQVMFIGRVKMDLYTSADPTTTFKYDRVFFGHNRMLDARALSKTIETDVNWFTTLDESNQIKLFVDLFRIGGGGIQKKLYLSILRCFTEKLNLYRKSHYEILPSVQSVKLLQYSEDTETYDTRNPATIEVEKQRKRWDDVLAKYESEVNENLSTFEKVGENNFGKSDKFSNITRTSPNKTGYEDIDMLQLLPVWIVKKILSYLEVHELQAVKKVNDYWCYVVEEMLKEMKSRQDLNKLLNDMKEEIDPEKLEEAMKEFGKKRSTKVSRQRRHSEEPGTISKKLIPKDSRATAETSLALETHKMRQDDFLSLSGELITFPRIIEKDACLYLHHPCMLKDTNVRIAIGQDIEQQRSVLTYELTTYTSSVLTNVSQQQMSEW